MKTITSQDLAVQTYVKLIRTAEALHTQVSRGLVSEGLTASQFSTLKVLRMNGALPQRDIAKYLLQSGGNITLVVDNLERDGLVQRIRDSVDRRIVKVGLTPKGEEVFDRIYPSHLERIDSAMNALDPRSLEILHGLLESFAAPGSEHCTPIKPKV